MIERPVEARRVVSVAGDGLLHPVALASIALLIANDHVLKSAAPGLVTGKLSDFAGLLFFPLLIQAAYEVIRAASGRSWGPSRNVLMVSIAVTAVGFGAIKLVPIAVAIVSSAHGTAQWLVGVALLRDGANLHAVQIARDPTDLVALPVLVITYLVGTRRARLAIVGRS